MTINRPTRYLLALLILLAVAIGSWQYYLNQRVDLPSFSEMNMPLPPIDLLSIGDDNYQLPESPFMLLVWATWCPTCIAEHDYLESVSEDIAIIGIVLRDDEDRVKDFLLARGNHFEHNFNDPTGSYADSIGSTGTPTAYFIDSDKVIRGRLLGGLNERKWERERLNRFALALN